MANDEFSGKNNGGKAPQLLPYGVVAVLIGGLAYSAWSYIFEDPNAGSTFDRSRPTVVEIPENDAEAAVEFAGTMRFEEGDYYRYGIVTRGDSDFWKVATTGAHYKTADTHDSVTVEEAMVAEGTVEAQQQAVEKLLEEGIRGIAISPVNAAEQTEWINSIAAQVPVVTYETDAPNSDRIGFVGTDNYAAGRECGRLIKETLPEGGRVLLCWAWPENSNSQLRRQGVIDELMGRDRDRNYYESNADAWAPIEDETVIDEPGYTLISAIDEGSISSAKATAGKLLRELNDIDLMVGLREHNVPAGYQLMKESDDLDSIPLVGFGEHSLTLEALEEGACRGTIVQDPSQYGFAAMGMLQEYQDGIPGAIPEGKRLELPTRTIAPDQLAAFQSELIARKKPIRGGWQP